MTAKETHIDVYLGNNNWLWIPVCYCFTAFSNTGGYIFCPYHGIVLKETISETATIKK